MTPGLAIEAPLRPSVPVEDVAARPGDWLLYNQSARRLNSALFGREQSVIADGPIAAVTHRQQSCNGMGGG